MASPLNPLRLDRYGFSFGYFALQRTDRKLAVQEAYDALRRTIDFLRMSKMRIPLDPLPELRVFGICGSCDLMLEVKHQDFRFVHAFQNELNRFSASTNTWIHALKYSSHSFTECAKPDFENNLSIQLYLRTEREHFKGKSLEHSQKIADKVRRLILDKEMDLNVFTTLGWPDCLLWGTLNCSPTDYVGFVDDLYKLSLEEEESQASVFIKRLTITGFLLDEKNEAKPKILESNSTRPGEFNPVIFARASPGVNNNTAIETLKDYAADLLDINRQNNAIKIPATVQILDGKHDYLLTFNKGSQTHIPIKTIAKAQDEFRRTSMAKDNPVFDKLETHLISSEGNSSKVDDNKQSLTQYENEEWISRRIQGAWETLNESGITTNDLVNELSNRLALLRQVNREYDNRAAVQNLIVGAIDSLEEILGHIKLARDQYSKMQQSHSMADRIGLLHKYLRKWSNSVGNSVRQRTSGSFFNFLERPYTNPSQRGSVQKILYVADGLMHEFYGFLPSELTTSRGYGLSGDQANRPPRLSALIGSDASIYSIAYLHTVVIPARYTFSLHRVLPQLWHEVGQTVFFQMFNGFVSAFGHKLVVELRKKQLDHLAVHYERRLSDIFCDVIVFECGFGGNYKHFKAHLQKICLGAAREWVASDTHLVSVFQEIIERLASIKVFGMVRRKDIELREGIKERLGHINFKEVAEEIIADFNENNSEIAGYSSIGNVNISKDIILKAFSFNIALNESVPQSLGNCLMPLSNFLNGTLIDTPRTDEFNKLKDGILYDIPSDVLVNEVFRSYYFKSLEKNEHHFCDVSALGFSGLNAFRTKNPWERGIKVRDKRTSGEKP